MHPSTFSSSQAFHAGRAAQQAVQACFLVKSVLCCDLPAWWPCRQQLYRLLDPIVPCCLPCEIATPCHIEARGHTHLIHLSLAPGCSRARQISLRCQGCRSSSDHALMASTRLKLLTSSWCELFGLACKSSVAHNRGVSFLQGTRKTVLVLVGSGYLGQFVVQHLLKSCRVGPAMLQSCALAKTGVLQRLAASAGRFHSSFYFTPRYSITQKGPFAAHRSAGFCVPVCFSPLLTGFEAVHLPLQILETMCRPSG